MLRSQRKSAPRIIFEIIRDGLFAFFAFEWLSDIV